MVCKCYNHDLIGVRSEAKLLKALCSEFVMLFAITMSRPGGFYPKCEYTVVDCNFRLLLSSNVKLLATLIITCLYVELISDEVRIENRINADASMGKTRISRKKIQLAFHRLE